MATLVKHTTPRCFQNCCCSEVLTAFQNLGRWLDELIIKVSHIVSHFFRTLANTCAQPFQNLGRWLHTHIDRSPPQAAPKTPPAPKETPEPPKVSPRKGSKRKRPSRIERLHDNWDRYDAEAKALQAARANQRSIRSRLLRTARKKDEESPAEKLQRELRAGMADPDLRALDRRLAEYSSNSWFRSQRHR